MRCCQKIPKKKKKKDARAREVIRREGSGDDAGDGVADGDGEGYSGPVSFEPE